MKEIEVAPGTYAVGKKIVELTFPRTAIIAMIKRGEKYITPNGGTVIEGNDVLIVLSDTPEGISKVYDSLQIRDLTP